MLVSVYDYEHRHFDVYRADTSKAQLGVAFGAPTRIPQGYGSPIGEAPEAAAMPLPEGAVFVGTSPHPVGVMCRQGNSPGTGLEGLGSDLSVGVSIGTTATVALTVAAIWWLGGTGVGKWLRKKVWHD
jgi:hypothetical protein